MKVRNFHEAIEKDLERLTAEIQEQKNRPETRSLSEREVLKKSVQAISGSSPQVQEPAIPLQKPSSPLPTYLDSGDPKIKVEVEKLIDLIFHEGLFKALKEAKKHPPFIEDAFHDALVDKLLPELKEKGIV